MKGTRDGIDQGEDNLGRAETRIPEILRERWSLREGEIRKTVENTKEGRMQEAISVWEEGNQWQIRHEERKRQEEEEACRADSREY